MKDVSIIGLDTAKSIFQLHGLDGSGSVVLERRLRRRELVGFFAKLSPCIVALEACGAAFHWARELLALGHEVRIIAPGFVKRFCERRAKNDARDAKALALAGLAPDLQVVPVKTKDQQAALMLGKTRGLLLRQRTQLSNALRGHLAEFGLVAKAGDAGLEGLIEALETGLESLPELALKAMSCLIHQWRELKAKIAELTAEVVKLAHADPAARRLMAVPGIGPIIAATFVQKLPDVRRFRSSRALASWLGLTPREHSSGGKRSLKGLTKAGDEELRSLLVLGAASRILHAKRKPNSADPWLARLIAAKPFKVAAVALAAKLARILWALSRKQVAYRPVQASP